MSELEKLKNLDDDYTRKKASFDNLPTFKRDMKERYDQVLLFVWLKTCTGVGLPVEFKLRLHTNYPSDFLYGKLC